MGKELTKIQNKICEMDGKFVVRACPGSGKTFTVAAKMAKLLKKWPYEYQGVAVISFTNVAWQEIERELKDSFSINIPIKHPHFLGTIDSFVNQFIFFPYGHLILNCENRPVLVGEPASSWKIKQFDKDHNQYFDKISFDIDGNIIQIAPYNQFFFGKLKKYNANGGKNGHYKKLKDMKKSFLKKGYVNQSDANYFAMILLQYYPSIARLISSRFPFIIIDEAQDTSEIQMKIIDILVENGLENLILVGDPDQAIFEWNDAKPELFNKKFDEWANITMNESWRSSKNICEFTFLLSNLNECSSPINKEVADHTHIPTIKGYRINNVNFDGDLIKPFLKICKEDNIPINHSTISVLARSNSLINEIILSKNSKDINKSNRSDVWFQNNFTKELAHSKYLHDKSEFQKSFKLLEKTYACIENLIYSDDLLFQQIKEKGYFNFKEEIFSLINLMPPTNMSIEKWITEFKENLNDKSSFPELILAIKDGYHDLTFDDLFGYKVVNKNCPYNLSTIHKVKGETFEAVLLIVKKKGIGAHYKTLLNEGKNTVDSEELRNIYVGITRPKKILVLAVPDEDKDVWEDYFSEKAKISPKTLNQPKESQKSLDQFFN